MGILNINKKSKTLIFLEVEIIDNLNRDFIHKLYFFNSHLNIKI